MLTFSGTFIHGLSYHRRTANLIPDNQKIIFFIFDSFMILMHTNKTYRCARFRFNRHFSISFENAIRIVSSYPIHYCVILYKNDFDLIHPAFIHRSESLLLLLLTRWKCIFILLARLPGYNNYYIIT